MVKTAKKATKKASKVSEPKRIEISADQVREAVCIAADLQDVKKAEAALSRSISGKLKKSGAARVSVYFRSSATYEVSACAMDSSDVLHVVRFIRMTMEKKLKSYPFDVKG